MQSGGGGMNAAQIARLQQQLAQYGRGNAGGQQPMMSQGGMGGMVNPQQQQQQQQQQQLQQAFMQQQQMQNQNQGGMQMRRNSNLGIGNNSAAALAMMQQQQQQGGNSQMTNANMSSYWNALQGQGGGGGGGDGSGGGAMDASTASSAQLAALTGMSMGGNSGSSGPSSSANLLLGNRGQSQGSQQSGQGMSGGINMQGMGQTNDAALLQQQIAQLQRQLQQHQQGGNQTQPNSMQGGLGGNSSGSFPMQNQSSQQQQLFQQMQQQMGNQQGGNQQGGMSGGNDQFSNMAAMMGGSRSSQSAPNVQQNLRSSMTSGSGSGLGGLGDSDLLQQQNLLRSSSMSQGMQNDASKAQEMFMMNQNNMQGNNQADLMGQRRSSVQMQDGMNQSMNSQSQSQNQMNQNNIMTNNNPFDMDGSMSSQRSNRQTSQGGSKPNDPNANQKSFLDGSFAGGWQSNADLPDRRRIIFSILEVIRQMRPDTNKISQKLPHMAKSLEEHLYRSAQTKEEYLDPSTLKKRLQLIAHGLELHRSTSSGSMQSSNSQNNSGGNSGAQQLQQLLQMQGGGNMNQNQQGMGMAGMGGGNNNQMDMLQSLGGGGMGSSMNSMMSQGGNNNSGILKNDNANYQDRIAAQKKKVIRQQQQRLLLLRHASKCKEGPNCKTKFCGQMMTLWKHMKKCRDKNCKTSHCLSSRCVLNHYRICKSQGRTATCEVCGPVMEQIKRQDQGDGMDSSDPLAAKPDPDLPNQALPQLNQSMNQGNMGGQNQSNVQAMQQQAMQQLYQKQQQAIQQNQQGPQGPQGGMQNQSNQMNQQNNQNNLQALGGGGFQGNMQNDDMQNSQGSGGGNQNDPQQLQQAQQKLVQQQQVLKQLQKQQAQLSEQQKQLQEQQALLKDPTTQQGQQLQQQHALLQQLQRRCQQQQALIQQELVLQMKVLQQGGQGGQQMNNSQMNNSQNSQNSQQSPQQGQMVRQSSVGSQNQNQNMQGNQLQAQMQALSQSAMAAMNDSSSNNNNNNNNNQMQQLQNQMQNQMQQMQNQVQNQVQNQMDSNIGGDLNPFGSEGVDQVDKSLDPMNAQQGSDPVTNDQQQQQQQPEQDNSQTPQDDKEEDNVQPNDSSNNANADDAAQPMSQKSSDGDKTKAKRRTSAKARTVPPPGGRGKGARGRGGKGKRLRDIADDLGASSRLGDKDEEGGSKKRGADEISGGDGNENAAKSSKTDPVPDSEKSQGSGKDGENGDSSLTSSMPKGDVEQHLLLLHKGLHLTSRTITHKCLPIVQQLIDDPFGWVFRDAVDPVVFGLPDYFEVVKNPMHLRLVKKKLENAVYTDMASFERDVKLVFENAILYNGEESEVGQLAKSMMGVFEREYKKVCEEIGSDLETVDPNACTLCGHERRQLEPPVLYCVGMSCGMQRIQRNASYYTDPSKQNCWCEKCYSKMKDDEVITLDDGAMTGKSKLVAAKHDSLPEEAWIQCDDCKAQVHEVCALYNCRKARSKTTFLCPRCVLKNRESEEKLPEHKHRACDLPSCKMSDSMEHGLQQTLGEAYKARALEVGVELSEVEKAEGLSIRVLSHIETKHTVRDLMYQRYSRVGCPTDYPVHTKCIGLFQSIDGVDVMLFAMYVYEYGDECPAPNRRRVYISYLDSVQYLRPKCYRTVAYQSVIVEYLRFVKKRGFHTAHIWSCPPTPGDEYVFYCHPSHQKIPNEDMLRNWYIQTLDRGKEEGIVLETTNFHDEYFKKGGVFSPTGSAPSPTCLPYFEGDYIPGEIENIISHLSEEERRRLPESPPPPSVPKRSGSKLGTRSNPGQLVNQTQDKIMLRLGKAIINMKDNFMIARLRSKEFAAAVDRGEDVSGWHEDDKGTTPIKGKGDPSSLKKEEEMDGEQAKSSSLEQIKSALSNKVGNTVDDDHQFESEMLENRQLFLNYCQGNHFQFDDLRHAKHSTLMILYQLHNPVIPKFFQKCGICYRDIVYGLRYKCIECTNFDMCKDCYHTFTDGVTSSHRGPPVDHDKRHTFTQVRVADPVANKKTEEERAKSLNAYLEVLTHAANCPGAPACKLNNCQKMKNLFVHVQTCDVTNKKSCKICARLLSLIIVHARSCTRRGSCPLPFCDRIRERNERMRRQQQFMDDRRREAQNEHYASAMQS